MKEKKAEAVQESEKIKPEIEKRLPSQIQTTSTIIAELKDKWQRAVSALGSESGRFLSGSDEELILSDQNYLIRQTELLGQLVQTLEAEPAGRITCFQDARADDEVSCIRLWPVFLDILKDRVPSDVLDNLGEDMIMSMRERRSSLNHQLLDYEKEVRIEANSIYMSLRSEISTKQRHINRLSKLGENLKFGNIEGVRINVELKNELLGTLQNCADQLVMFSKDSRPIEESLAEYFETQLQTKMEGQSLLDYRTYMDLFLEIRRKKRDWEHASSLSGGESIGCGLAIGLMLIRSLASRSDLKAEHITPLFVIDEVHRLDAAGQKTIIEFGKKEGFQVLVTAASLIPEYKCTLYALSRVFTPEEQLIIRGLRIKTKQKVEENA